MIEQLKENMDQKTRKGKWPFLVLEPTSTRAVKEGDRQDIFSTDNWKLHLVRLMNRSMLPSMI